MCTVIGIVAKKREGGCNSPTPINVILIRGKIL
jgi:hypothetical protein